MGSKKTVEQCRKLGDEYFEATVKQYSELWGEWAELWPTLPEDVAREFSWHLQLVGDFLLNYRKYKGLPLFDLMDDRVEWGRKEMRKYMDKCGYLQKNEPASDESTGEGDD